MQLNPYEENPMKKMLFALAGLLVLTGAALTASSSTHRKIHTPTATAVVHQVVVGFANGVPTVSQDLVTINWVNGDSVRWVPAPGITSFTIQFASGTPFNQAAFASAGGSMSSGGPRANSGGTYKYSVWVNGKWLDPRVVVEPPS